MNVSIMFLISMYDMRLSKLGVGIKNFHSFKENS